MTNKRPPRRFVYVPPGERKNFITRKCKTSALYVKKEHAMKAAEFFTKKLGIRFKAYKCGDHYHMMKIKEKKK